MHDQWLSVINLKSAGLEHSLADKVFKQERTDVYTRPGVQCVGHASSEGLLYWF